MAIPAPKPQFKPKPKKKNKSKRGNRAKRNDYSIGIRNRIRKNTGGLCQHCIKKGVYHSYDSLHHPYPRSHGGRGVYSNAYPVCYLMHEVIESDAKLRLQIRAEFEQRFGKYFYMDKQDIESLWRYRKEIDFEAIKLWEKFNRQKVDL